MKKYNKPEVTIKVFDLDEKYMNDRVDVTPSIVNDDLEDGE